MYNKVIAVGNKIEFKTILRPEAKQEGIKPETYVSQVLDIDDDGNVNVAMPIVKGRLIPLSKGEKFDAYFFTQKGMYYAKVVILERYKNGNIYSMDIEFKTEPQRYQRRQYFRLEKTVPIWYVEISDASYKKMMETKQLPEEIRNAGGYAEGATCDISGGGLRFTGPKKIESGKKLFAIFDISGDASNNKFKILANVIRSFEIEGRRGLFEHRVEFNNISNEYREQLIKFIFEEERKMRRTTK